MRLSAIILTFNEEIHLERCLDSIKDVVDDIVIVDCYSSDRTVEIAAQYGANILQNPWVNYATQFNWALGELDCDTDWVLRIDADEFIDEKLKAEINKELPSLPNDIHGIYVNRWMTFQGKLIKHGGVFPVSMLRLFRYGKGQCENRWMDEHIKVAGSTVKLSGDLVDDNLNSLTWWTEKHNKYANREAVDLLNIQYGFMEVDSIAGLRSGAQADVKRWFKERIYAHMPGGFRAFLYFFYRYFLRFGFLDGSRGTAFHFLQGFWYRYLVDAKVNEVKRYMRAHGVDIREAINRVLGVKV